MSKNIKTIAFGAAMLALTVSAFGQTQYFSHYDVNIEIGQEVKDLFLLETDGGTGLREVWAFNASGHGTSHMDVFFPSDAPIASSLFVGVTQDLDSDPILGVKHIVLFMDSTAAGMVKDISWPTIYRHTDEAALINSLYDATESSDEDTVNSGIDALTTFGLGDGRTGIVDNFGQPASSWFNMGADFKAVAFSDGQIIGSGQSSMTAVPEPATLAVLGIGLLPFLRRRKN